MESVESLILEHLKALRATVDHLENEVKEIKSRLTKLAVSGTDTKKKKDNLKDEIYRMVMDEDF